jgi:hypothetical protein
MTGVAPHRCLLCKKVTPWAVRYVQGYLQPPTESALIEADDVAET